MGPAGVDAVSQVHQPEFLIKPKKKDHECCDHCDSSMIINATQVVFKTERTREYDSFLSYWKIIRWSLMTILPNPLLRRACLLAHSQSWLPLPLAWTVGRESTLTQNSEHSL